MVMFLKNYFSGLIGEDRDRYETKIKLCDGVDPFEIDISQTKSDNLNLPDICYGDIFAYLVFTTHTHTMNQMKSYKALEAHNFFTSGHVQEIKYKVMSNGIVIVLGIVKHSYAMNDVPLKAWVAAKKQGDVLTGHCNCMAGIGESCSHVGAMLFALEYATFKRKQVTCTSLDNKWLPPALRDIPCTEIRNCKMVSAKKKYNQLYESPYIIASSDEPKKRKYCPMVSDEEREKFLLQAAETGENCAVMAVLPGLCKRFATAKEIKVDMPPFLTDLFSKEHCQLALKELQIKSEDVMKSLTITERQILEVEKATKEQSNCKLWMKCRAGRLTASKMKAACRTKIDDPSVSLIKNICYPEETKFFSKYTEYGKKNEKNALAAYEMKMKPLHDQFSVEKAGFRIHAQHPFIGASPDGITKCNCHGSGLVEIKCSFYPKMDSCGLENGQLGEDHKHYYQIQTQLLVWDLEFCDFVVWNEDLPLQNNRILKNETFQKGIIMQASIFFKSAILPELLGRYYSSQKNTVLKERNCDPELVCICQKPARDPMIACCNEACNIGSFHWKCVGVKGNRKKWYCDNCLQSAKKIHSAKVKQSAKVKK